MNKWAALVFFFSISMPSRAQYAPQADLMVMYSHLEVLKGYTISMNGGSASTAYSFNRWFGVASDFGAYHGYPGESLTGATFTLGPRVTWRRFRLLQPFGEGLLGGSHFNLSSGGITGGGVQFTFGGGAGLDIALGHQNRVAARIQRDYFAVRSGGSNTVCDRISAGIVYRFGNR